MSSPYPDEPYWMGTVSCCTGTQEDPCSSRHTTSRARSTASASYPPSAPGTSTWVPAGTEGSAAHGRPAPPMPSARPSPSSSHALPPPPNPRARTLPATGADTVQFAPSRHAARTLPPAASSATFPPASAASPSTRTRLRSAGPGSRRPADRQVPPTSVKTPATPGRVQPPAAIGLSFGPNDTAVTPSRPQERPWADAARARNVVSTVHRPAAAAPAVGDASIVPSRSTASRRPDGPRAIAPGAPAKPASSSPGVHDRPASVLVASGEKTRFWLGRTPTTRAEPPPAATRPPLTATPGGVTSDQRPAPAGRAKSCQKRSAPPVPPPMTATAQAPWPVTREVLSGTAAGTAAAGP